ncbi:acyl-CoA dehydrogenase [Desulfosporosinus acidiphilus SJ4]|uniref:Acyl-CoA dehydrogenase n=1 Tax=Desulfosporosinus acidiphilus (strain DSM 22704 / JCM 16185 / SJ4) TaxID=646529 RepID=I4D1T8_DESAJ|nr:acyl-CoA dehydrogenase family protein [Desulfosporosinus acidiphilus]AFM39762.1 acyl-CoA dehydrogenase [Desulfosporosinus acidiphilus SJ4]
MAESQVTTEELNIIRQTVHNFIAKEVEPLAQQMEEEDMVPRSLLDKAAEIGLFGLSTPQEYGGLGAGMVGKVMIYEELGRGPNCFTSIIGCHNGIGSVGIVECGSEEQKERYLPKIASGQMIGAFALTEASAGSDPASLKTTAVLKGDRYVLNGTKQFITNGDIANIFTVMAITDKSKGSKGITSFLVERNFKGFSVGKFEKKMGLHGSQTAELIFEDCEVPVENVLGEVGQGYVNALRILANGRAGLAARNLGSCEKLLEVSVKYALQRIQFGKPIFENQIIQHYLANMAIDIEALRSLTYDVARKIDEGQKVIKEAAIVKAFGSEAFGRVADLAVQIHGGMGYMRECEVERYYRDARIARIYEGTSEIQRNIIAAQLRKEFV